jgi:SpoVK/Ycf46/Vps4 family AAA+-type ATPase
MQERKGEAFVIATANDVSSLPPELLRKGRFDEFFFVDLPNGQERFAVLQAALLTNGRKDHKIDVVSVGNACKDFTGAEIAALVPEAMFRAFADKGREITTRDLLDVAAETVPMAKTQSEKIEKLRTWAKGRARTASAIETAVEQSKRQLDI